MKNSLILRVIALVLVSLMLFGAVGCDMASIFGDMLVDEGNGINQADTSILGKYTSSGDGKEPTDRLEETAEAQTDNEEISFAPIDKPAINLNFEGKEICILTQDSESNSREWFKDEAVDVIDSCVALRNQFVEEEINAVACFSVVPYTNISEYTNHISNLLMSDIVAAIHDYDVASSCAPAATAASIRDLTANLADESVFPYFDLTLPCWNQSIVKNTTVNNRLHYLVGDVNLSMIDSAYVVWQNNNLYDKYREDSDYHNLQELVMSDKWTYEVLYSWATRVYENRGGGESSNLYALMAGKKDTLNPTAYSFMHAFELEFTIENGDSTRSVKIVANHKAEEALVKVLDLYANVGVAPTSNVDYFTNGNVMFYIDGIYENRSTNQKMRAMADEYSILPMPKYDDTQENYVTGVKNQTSLMFALDHSNGGTGINGELISAFLQLSSEYSYSNIRHKYFNTVIGSNSIYAEEIFNIIVSNIRYSFTYVYSSQLGNLANLWLEALHQNTVIKDCFYPKQREFEQYMNELNVWLGLK